MARLGDICTIQSGGTPSRHNKAYWDDGTIPWVKISDIKDKYLDATEERITKLGLENSSAKIFPAGTILYTIFATLGEVCILNIEAATNQAISGIQLESEQVDKNYLYHYLSSLKSIVNNIGRGVAQNNINMTILRNFEIPLPPLEEQRKIAAVLDKVSDLIAKRRTQLDKLDELVKSRFIEMFGEKYPFDKIENLIDRKIVSARKIFSQHDVIKYIDISSIDNIKNKIDRYTEYQMTDAPSRAQQCIKENDIIVSTVRPNLKNIAINQMKYDNLVVSSGFCVLRPKKCNPLYLFIALLQDNFTNKMIEKTTGANYPAINLSNRPTNRNWQSRKTLKNWKY